MDPAQQLEFIGEDAGGTAEDVCRDAAKSPDSYLPEAIQFGVRGNRRVGDILITSGLVTREQVEEVLAAGERKRIGTALIERGIVSEEQLLVALATKFAIPFVDLARVNPSAEALIALPKAVATKMSVFPYDLQGKKLFVATSEPTDTSIVNSLSFITNLNIEIAIASAKQIARAINTHYDGPKETLSDFITDLTEELPVVVNEEDAPLFVEPDSKVIRLVNKILVDAYSKCASDIHFEPELGTGPLGVRYRIDGECVLAYQVPAAHKAAVIARLKIMARLDIAERRKPQSGKIVLLYEQTKLEYRLEITPTVDGHEDAVLRLLTGAKPLALDQMGFSPENLEKFRAALQKPYGIILCAGPTGSGKTTTLHSALASINSPERKIWTAEDPVEIVQQGLRQVQVNPKIGFGFDDALRSFLRADPDVIMIGEMRDAETSKTAIAASLTGHLVFSTLHTNSAPETVRRLIEMGIDQFNFADALLAILAQRLARKLCDRCKEPHRITAEGYDELVHHYGEMWFVEDELPAFSDHLGLMKAKGCPECAGTGYRGRIALHEILVGSSAVKTAIKTNVPLEELREIALYEGSRTLKMDGIRKVFQGITDLPQVLKVCIF